MSKYNQNHDGDDSEDAYDDPNHPCRCAGLDHRFTIGLFVGTGLDFGVVIDIRLFCRMRFACGCSLNVILLAAARLPCGLGSLDRMLRSHAVWCAPCRFLYNLIHIGVGGTQVR